MKKKMRMLGYFMFMFISLIPFVNAVHYYYFFDIFVKVLITVICIEILINLKQINLKEEDIKNVKK